MVSKSASNSDSFTTDELDISFVTSNKGKRLLVLKNYLFKCNRTTPSKKYWSCTEKDCGVYTHTSLTDEFICIRGTHNHPANPDQIQVKIVKDKMKERILGETTSITKIYDEEIVKANLSKAAVAIIPTVIEYRMYR